jgi:hypothetical protein
MSVHMCTYLLTVDSSPRRAAHLALESVMDGIGEGRLTFGVSDLSFGYDGS